MIKDFGYTLRIGTGRGIPAPPDPLSWRQLPTMEQLRQVAREVAQRDVCHVRQVRFDTRLSRAAKVE